MANRIDEPGNRSGLACIILAHLLWGFFPLFWRQLFYIPAPTLLAHRILWSFVWLCLLGCLVPRLRRSLLDLGNLRHFKVFCFAAAMIGINWGMFLYSVSVDQVLQASLGYYINPLLSVLLGVLVLGERMDPVQWIAIGLAAVGVVIMALAGSGFPWIALTLAGAFALYGLAKKKAPYPPMEGLAVESFLLLPITAILLATVEPSSDQAYHWSTWAMLCTGGLITIIPLALFAFAAQRVSMATIGIAQYVGPTIQWFVGAIILGEPFGKGRIFGFSFVWVAVILFVVGGLRKHRS